MRGFFCVADGGNIDVKDLIRWFDDLSSRSTVVVALSGGVDSSVVAAAAWRAVGVRATAVTARSPSVAQWQIEMASSVASSIGIAHRWIDTGETSRPDYIRNDRRRCFYCKQTLYDSLGRIAESFVASAPHRDVVLISGTNADDLGDHRPGIRAGSIAGVRTPLADLQIGKSRVRRLAEEFGLPNAELPASPCLASRIAYGTAVTVERLAMVERAEEIVRGWGFDICRVRLSFAGGRVRGSLEVVADRVGELRRQMDADGGWALLRGVGFEDLVVDLAGFRSGKLNDPGEALVSIGGTDGG